MQARPPQAFQLTLTAASQAYKQVHLLAKSFCELKPLTGPM